MRIDMADRTMFTVLTALTTMMMSQAHAQSVQTKDVTTGACMVICEDVSFCRELDYDSATGTCTIFINANDPGYGKIQQACPQIPPDKLIISYANDRWDIMCPSGTAGSVPDASQVFGTPQ